MVTLGAIKGSTGMRKCAFCRYYYDPTNEAISPKRGTRDVWEYKTKIAKPCQKKANRNVESQATCPWFECKL